MASAHRDQHAMPFALSNTLRTLLETAEYAVAVSLDIKNAFNSVPWILIRRALSRRGFPDYLRRVLDDYLHARFIELRTADGNYTSFPMRAGVLQGSILGSLLWNIAFDDVPNSTDVIDCSIVCYADDTLILARGRNLFETIARASLQTRATLRRIGEMGLTVATEIILFHGRGNKPLQDLYMSIGGKRIQFKDSIKYLGIFLDSRLTFGEHFRRIETKTAGVTRALSRLMPNLRGSGERKRRLYANIVASVILYGALIWADTLSCSRSSIAIFRRLQRSYALRVIGAYRTVSSDAACLLARLPPLDLARARKRTFERVAGLRLGLEWSLEREREIHKQEEALVLTQWRAYLSGRSIAGVRTRDAILPSFTEWISRKWGCLSFHMTQIMTGHRCFGTYLRRIGKAETDRCAFCTLDIDSAEHTLSEYHVWAAERSSLQLYVGRDCSLPDVIIVISTNREAWSAFAHFSSQVMRTKENAERIKQAALIAPFDPG